MKSFGFWLLLLVISFKANDATIDLSGIHCESRDKPYADFEYCDFKIVNRTYKYIELKLNLNKIPVNNVTVTVSVMKNVGGYKPFLYNMTVDGCKFLKNRKSGLVAYFYNFIKFHSNMNHSCPFNHDVIIHQLDTKFLNSRVVKLLPLPDGEYALFTTWTAYNTYRVIMNFYYTMRF